MNPNTGQGPYDTAIQDVERQIEDLQRTLETLFQLKARHDGTAGVPITAARTAGNAEISHDTFFGMTIAEAAQKYLAMTKVTKSTADIAAALEQGGLKHSSKDFPANVRSIIGQRDEFVRVPNGDWGLGDWYPGLGRGKKPKPEKAPKAKAKAPKSKSGSNAAKPKLEDQIIEAMKADLDKKDWSSTEIANAIGAQRTSVQSTMSRMGKDGTKIAKAEKGYRLVKAAVA